MKGYQFFIVMGMLVAVMGIAGASALQIAGPISASLTNGGAVYLGKIGPGQSFYISASADTYNASGSYINIAWDTLKATQLPAGWSSQRSPLYADPMKMKINVPPDAPNGTYTITVQAVDLQNYSRISNVTFNAYINVTPNVFSLGVTPTSIATGIGQPTNLYITINNTGVSDNPFVLNAYGLPAWNISDQVIALHGSKSTFVYPVYVNEPGVYKFNLTVNSGSSPLIQKSYRVQMTAKASLGNDYSAIGQGVLLSPIIYEPAYAFMFLLGKIYHIIAG